jgi:thiazole synthase ThiGH ThiG subunit
VIAGRRARLAGRVPERRYAQASSPVRPNSSRPG